MFSSITGSLASYNLPESSTVDMVPCESAEPDLCFIAMTKDDISPPAIFSILISIYKLVAKS